MGVICKNNPSKIKSRKNNGIDADVDQNISIDINDYSEESLKNQRDDLKKKQKEFLTKINIKFNALIVKTNKEFLVKIILFYFLNACLINLEGQSLFVISVIIQIPIKISNIKKLHLIFKKKHL